MDSGRLGEDFGSNAMNIREPDMMVVAKQLSSAYFPISATIVSGRIAEQIQRQTEELGALFHGYTYSGHPVGCAVALKTLEIYERDSVFETAAATGVELQERLREFDDHPLVGEVRGKGLIAAIEPVANKVTGEAFPDNSVVQLLQKKCPGQWLNRSCSLRRVHCHLPTPRNYM